MKPKPGSMKIENERCAFLHGLCQEIDRLRASGLTVKGAVRRVRLRRRMRLFTRGRLSFSALLTHYYTWRKWPSLEAHWRLYRTGANPKRRIPIALYIEILNRLAGDRILPAATVVRSMHIDWKAGKSMPGLGTWREYLLRLNGERALPSTPPPFPCSRTSLYQALGGDTSGEYCRRISAALRAQRELARFFFSSRVAAPSSKDAAPTSRSARL